MTDNLKVAVGNVYRNGYGQVIIIKSKNETNRFFDTYENIYDESGRCCNGFGVEQENLISEIQGEDIYIEMLRESLQDTEQNFLGDFVNRVLEYKSIKG